MKQYMLLFRLDILSKDAQPNEKEMKVYMTQWMEWINWISEQGLLAEGGNHLMYTGKLLRPGNTVQDLPYSANKESIAGYILINAKNLVDATRIAKKCPILNGGPQNSVEIRETAKT